MHIPIGRPGVDEPDHPQRREFIAGLGGGVATWPVGVRAQQPTLHP